MTAALEGVSGQQHAPAALNPRERPGTHCTGGWVGPRVGLVKGKAVPLHAWTGPEGSRKLRLPDFVTTAQDGSRFSALRTGRLYPQEILLVLISVRG